MSKARRKSTAGTATQKKRTGSALTLAAARNMLPLVSHIVEEVQGRWNRVAQLEREQADLEKRRRNLEWAGRSRRYVIGDEIAAEQRGLQDAVAELEQLQIILVDPAKGEAAFPTVINSRRAYFTWELGADDLTGWCYANDSTRHAIPAGWNKTATA